VPTAFAAKLGVEILIGDVEKATVADRGCAATAPARDARYPSIPPRAKNSSSQRMW